MNKVLLGMKRIQLCALLLLLATAAYAAPEKELTVGVLAFRPKPETVAKWQPLADHLTQRLHGTKVHLKVMSYPELEEALDKKMLDFVLTNPGHYVQLRNNINLSGALATLVESEGGIATDSFGGTIFVRQDREDIRELSHLKGKTIAVVSASSLGGYQIQAQELLHAGVRLDQIKIIMTKTPHDLVVDAVLQGKADAGFARSGVLEAMAREGKLDMSGVKVLARREIPMYPYAVSTKLYPEWPFIALPHVNDDIARQVAAALLGMEHDGAVTRNCGIHGFTIPADYTSVENLLRELRLPPFDKSPQFTLQDIWLRHRFGLTVMMIAGLIIGSLVLWLIVINRRLGVAREKALENEERFRSLFEKVPVVSLVIDPVDGTILDANTAATVFYGWSHEQLLRKKIAEINTLSGEVLKKELEAAKNETRSYFVFQHRRADGSTSDVEVYSGPIRIGNKTVLYSIIHDITERRNAEEKLKQSLSLLKATLQSTADGILVVNADGTITDFNDQFVKLWGIPKSILDLHDDQKAIEFVLEQLKDPEQFLAKVRELYADQEATSFDVLEFKDGRVFERYSQPQRIDGRPVGRVWSFRDVTTYRKAEEALRTSEEMFHSIYDHIGSGVAVIGRNMEILSLNPLMREWFPHIDTSQHHICYRSFNTPPRDSVCSYCPTILTLMDGQVHSADTDTPTPDGLRHYHIISSPLFAKDGSVFAAIEMVQDITEHKAIEMALIDSEKKFRTITSAAADAVILINDQGKITLWNAAAEMLFGYSDEDARDLELHQLIAPVRYHEAFRRGFSRFVETGEGPVLGKTLELSAIRKDGNEFSIEITISALELNGRWHALGIIRDITDRKRAEEALRKTQFVVDSTSDGVYWVGDDAKIVSVNDAVCKSLGYSRDELLTMTVHDISPDFPPEVWAQHWKVVRERKSFSLETSGKTRDGRVFPVEVMINYVQFDDKEYNCAFVRDITARRQGEDLLRRSEERFRGLIEASAQIVWSCNPLGEVTEDSPSWRAYTGQTFEQWSGYGYVDCIHPDDRAVVMEHWKDGSQKGLSVTNEYRLRHHSGEWRWTHARGVPIRDKSETVVSWVGMNIDIHDRKQVEIALRESEERFRTLFEKAGVVNMIIDPADGSIVDANAAAAQFYGWSRDELRTMNSSSLTTLSRQDMLDKMDEARREQRSYFQVPNLMSDGSIRDVEIYSGPLYMGGRTLIYAFIHDITERKQMEKMLRENEEKFRTIFDSSPVPYGLNDDRGNIILLNKAFIRIFGYTLEDIPTLSDWWPKAYPDPEYRRWVATTWQAHLEKVEIDKTDFEPMEVEIRCKNGMIRTIIAGAVRLEGALTRIHLVILYDITERTQIEKSLQESEERYRQLVNQSPDAICVHQQGKFVFLNKAALMLFGAAAEQQLIGMPIIDRVHPGYRDLVLDRIRLISNDQRTADFIEEKLLRLDGTVVNVEICGVPISYQGYPAVQVVVHDITERKQTEEKIRQLAQELNTILSTLTVGVSYLKNRRVQWANSAHDMIFGYGPDGSKGLETSVFYADEQEYKRVGAEGYGRLAKGVVYTTEVEMKRRDGTRFWCSLTGRAVNPANLAEGSIWMLQDITGRKHAEAALQDKTHQLETLAQTLEQRVTDEVALRVKNEQFLIQQAKLAAMGEMLGAIAHQWRQPLNALGLCVQNIRDAYLHHDLNREYLDTTVTKSMDQIQHMSKTIDDFRSFFAPDKEKRLFDTMAAAGDVLSLFGAQLTANDISFRLTCHTHKKTFYAVEDIIVCPEKSVLGYQNEFEHVILNLVSNAKDAIIARREADRNALSAPGLITFDFYNRDNNVVIEVGDSGTGIPESIMPRIFEPYFTMKEQSKGTGIGLYMSKIIIEDHMKGSLTAENGQDGAIFTIVLRQTEGGPGHERTENV